MTTRHLNQTELAARWTISPRTLERWRFTGEGPQFIKIGGRVAYRLEDIEGYEAEQRAHGGSGRGLNRRKGGMTQRRVMPKVG